MEQVAATDEMQREKQALRQEMRRLRAAVTPEAARLAGESAAALLDAQFADGFGAVKVALLYAPLAGELDTAPLDELLRRRGIVIAYPRVFGDALHLYAAAPADLVRGRFAIGEPPATAPSVSPAAIDLAIIPGLAFDRRGHRLGFGRGFYDRLLALAPRATRIGVCLPFQLIPRVPDEPHDIALDLLFIGDPHGSRAALHQTHARAHAGRSVPSKENH